jgi:hypothetical protein
VFVRRARQCLEATSQPLVLVRTLVGEVNDVDYRQVLREDVTGNGIPVTPFRAHKRLCVITPIRQLRLVAAQHVVCLVVDDVRTPVQEEIETIGFVVQSVSGLRIVWALVDPIIDKVTHVDPVLVQNAAGVQNVDDLQEVIPSQRNFEDTEPLLENPKHSLNGLPLRFNFRVSFLVKNQR